MKCPVCKIEFGPIINLEKELKARECPHCAGVWIPGFNYIRYIDHSHFHREDLEKIDLNSLQSDHDTREAKICPDCGSIIERQKLNPVDTFAIERCGHCAGIWLDKGEWDVLKSHGLKKALFFIFSQTFQHFINQKGLEQSTEERYVSLLGQEGFDKLKGVKTWLQSHDYKNEILSYLMK